MQAYRVVDACGGITKLYEERKKKKLKKQKQNRERDLRASRHHPASLHHQTTKTTGKDSEPKKNPLNLCTWMKNQEMSRLMNS
ncbi:hypothetical protein CMV_018314 [Castanea mollissima]|nr:hypothetical protein CMV_018314 [Castanea mollissima]